MKSILSDLKPIKTGKQPGTTYCLGCKIGFKIMQRILDQKK